MKNKIVILTSILTSLVLIVCVIFCDIAQIASFSAGFLGFIMIMFLSFYRFINNIKKQSEKSTNKDAESRAKIQNKQYEDYSFGSKIIIGTKLSLSFLRLISYISFVVIVLILIEYKLFAPTPLLIGVSAGLISTIAWSFYKIKT